MNPVNLSARQWAEDTMINLVRTRVQSSGRHLETVYRKLEGKMLSDLKMEHISTFGSINWLSFLGS